MANVEVLNGFRNESGIYHCNDGYYYHYNNCNEYARHGGGVATHYLRCKNYYSRGCTGSAKVSVRPEGLHWENGSRHTCGRDQHFARVRALRHQVIQEAVRLDGPFEQPAAVVERVRNRADAPVAARVTPELMRGPINRARNAVYPRVPISLFNLGNVLNQPPNAHITRTIDGNDNIFDGTVNLPNGISSIFFLSRRMKRFMRRVRIVFCDGTFSSRPNIPPSAQVLQLSAVVRNHVVPLAQILTTGKTEAEYIAVLQHLRRSVPGFNPRIVMTDFEPALQSAWQMVFGCHVAGCYWHYCRAILKKAREMGLVPLMNENPNVKKIIRSCCALALLPADVIRRGLRILMVEAIRNNLLQPLHPFFLYMINTWTSDRMLVRLSVFRMKHRTNNVAEAANKILRRRTGAHRPGLWHFLSALRQGEQSAYTSLRTIGLGLPAGRRRKVSAINNDRVIKNLTRSLFDGVISIRTFLHRASLRVLNVFDGLMA